MLSFREDPNTGRIALQFKLAANSQVINNFNQMTSVVLMPPVMNNGTNWVPTPLTSNIVDMGRFVYTWTDRGNCPHKPCDNGAVCGMRGVDDYFCTCPAVVTGGSGNCSYNSSTDLTWLLILAIVVALLIILLMLICCCVWCCCHHPRGGTVVEEVIEEVPEPVTNYVQRDEVYEATQQLPQQTYYHVIGQPLPFRFNAGRPTSVMSAPIGRYNGGSLGRSAMGLPMIKPSSGLGDYDSPIQSDKRYVVAYNDRTFGSAGQGLGFSAGSVLNKQPY